MAMLNALFRLTLRDPKAAMRALLNLRLSSGSALAALALMAVLTAILTRFILSAPSAEECAQMGLSPAACVQFSGFFNSPLLLAAAQFAVYLVMAFLIWQVGAWRGGQGDFTGAVLALAWLQAVMFVVQLVQILLVLALPPVGALFGLVTIVYFFMLLTAFVTELHGFRSARNTFFGIILAGAALLLALSMLLVFILPPEALA